MNGRLVILAWLLGTGLGGLGPLAAQEAPGEQRVPNAPVSWIGVLLDIQVTASAGGESVRIVVDQISDGGPAEAGGLRPGDRILAMEGTSVTYDRWMRSVPRLEPGDPLRLTVVRTDGSTENVTIVAQPRPPSDRSRIAAEIAVARDRFQRNIDSLLVNVAIELRDSRQRARGLRFRIGPREVDDEDSLTILARAVDAQIRVSGEGPPTAQRATPGSAPMLRPASGGAPPRFRILTPQIVGEAYLLGGAEARTVTGRLAAYFGVENGVLVTDVLRGSPAAQVGFLPGDVIVSVGGKPASTVPDLRIALDQLSIPFEVQVIRRGTNLFLRFPHQ